jgi:hypothetical protein
MKCLIVFLIVSIPGCSFISDLHYFTPTNKIAWKGSIVHDDGLNLESGTAVGTIYDTSGERIGSVTLRFTDNRVIIMGLPYFMPCIPVFPLFYFHHEPLFFICDITIDSAKHLISVWPDSVAKIIINSTDTLPLKVTDTHSSYQLYCSVRESKVKSFQIIMPNPVLNRAFALTTFRKKHRLYYKPYFRMN